jgi:hypothetical protein
MGPKPTAENSRINLQSLAPYFKISESGLNGEELYYTKRRPEYMKNGALFGVMVGIDGNGKVCITLFSFNFHEGMKRLQYLHNIIYTIYIYVIFIYAIIT